MLYLRSPEPDFHTPSEQHRAVELHLMDASISRQRRGRPAELIILVLAVAGYNNLINLVPVHLHDRFYVPLNLAVLALALVWATKGMGLSREDLGASRKGFFRSAGIGIAIGILLPAALLVLAAFPDLFASHFADPRLTALRPAEAAYRAGVRIPLGTALFEEGIFRGILYGRFLVSSTPWRAALASSSLFAVWHVTPTLRMLQKVDILSSPVLLGFALTGSLLLTFVAGLLFVWLRHRTGHVAGCVFAHWLINALATVAFFLRG